MYKGWEQDMREELGAQMAESRATRHPFSLDDRLCPKCLATDPTVRYRSRYVVWDLQDEWLELTCRCGYVWFMEVHVPVGRKAEA